MTHLQLERFAIEMSKKYKNKQMDIIDLVKMAYDEIEDGGSEEHECDLACQSIKDLISEV